MIIVDKAGKIAKVVFPVIIVFIMLGISQTALASGTFRTTAGVHMRSSPSTNATSLSVVSANTSVEVLVHDPAGWSKVLVGSTVGYIRSDFLKFPIGDTSATFYVTAGVHMRSSPSTSATSLRVVSANSSVEVLEHDPAGWSRVRVGETTGHIRSDFLRRAVTDHTAGAASNSTEGGGGSGEATGQAIGTLRTIGNVNMRSSPSTTSSIIRTLTTGTSVDVLANESNGWSKVRVAGLIGYIRSDLLASSTSTAQATQTLRTIGTVNMRLGASTTSSIIRTLPTGTSVEVTAKESNGWSKVIHDSTNGYIRSDLLTSSTSTAQATQTLRTIGTVNMRSSASTSSSIIRTLAKGTSVGVVATESNGWSRVTHNGTYGYIRSDLLTSSTVSEEAVIASVVTSSRINLRSGPSTTTGILRTLEAGTYVEVLANESNGWSKVRVAGLIGYIRSDLLQTSGSVELLEWSQAKDLFTLYSIYRVTDVRTGISFNIRPFSKSTHLDYEPVTRADTEAILRIRNGVWSWSARPVWVTVGNRTIAAATHAMPHDVSTIRDNGMNGHLCLHFKGSTAISQTYQRDMQNSVQEAFDKRVR